MHFSSFFLVRELFELRIVCLESFNCPSASQKFGLGWQLGLKDLARSATFLLFNIVHVTVAEQEHDAEAQKHVAIRIIVVGIGFVPLWKLTNRSVSMGGTVSFFEFSLDPKSYFESKLTLPAWKGCCCKHC